MLDIATASRIRNHLTVILGRAQMAHWRIVRGRGTWFKTDEVELDLVAVIEATDKLTALIAGLERETAAIVAEE